MIKMFGLLLNVAVCFHWLQTAIMIHFSLGGFTALATAGDLPEQVIGVALLNSAGQFGNPDSTRRNVKNETTLQKYVLKPLKELFQRIALGFLFWQAKQPARIESVLRSVCSLYFWTFLASRYLLNAFRHLAALDGSGHPCPDNMKSSYFTHHYHWFLAFWSTCFPLLVRDMPSQWFLLIFPGTVHATIRLCDINEPKISTSCYKDRMNSKIQLNQALKC